MCVCVCVCVCVCARVRACVRACVCEITEDKVSVLRSIWASSYFKTHAMLDKSVYVFYVLNWIILEYTPILNQFTCNFCVLNWIINFYIPVSVRSFNTKKFYVMYIIF